MNKGKVHAQAVGDSRGPLRTTGIWTHNDSFLVVRNVLLDIAFEQRPTIKIIHRDVEKALVLRIMQI